jgi:hypothetical protein
MDQGWVPESFLEAHDNGLLINLRNDIPLIAEMLDELPEGLSLFLDNAGVENSYAAPQAHRIVNVALYQEYSAGIVFIYSQGWKYLYHV